MFGFVSLLSNHQLPASTDPCHGHCRHLPATTASTWASQTGAHLLPRQLGLILSNALAAKQFVQPLEEDSQWQEGSRRGNGLLGRRYHPACPASLSPWLTDTQYMPITLAAPTAPSTLSLLESREYQSGSSILPSHLEFNWMRKAGQKGMRGRSWGKQRWEERE